MNPARRALISCLIPISLGACALKLPTAAPEAELPADWKNAAGFPVASPKDDLARWWRKFDDPVLTRVIADGLANNPDLSSASARIREARARRNVAAATLFPFVSGSASSDSSVVKTDGNRRVSETRYSAGLDASWEADLFGKNRSKVAAAAAEIATAYTRLRAYETGLTILQNIVKTREQTTQLATWRQMAGETDSLESSQAISSLEQARASVPSLEQSIAQTRNLLALLCGRQPGSLDGVLASGNRAIPDPARSLAIGIPADTIRQRPDVRLAGYQLLAAVANTRAAEAERFPSLGLSGSLGVNSLTAGKLFDPQTASADIIAGLTGPIFDAGRIRSNIEAQGAVQDRAVQTYRSSILTALSEVEDSLIACQRSTERLATLEKAAAAAREADVLARQRYQAGEIDFLDVLDSQRTLLNLEDSLLNTRTDRTTAYIRLYQALGGGWSAAS